MATAAEIGATGSSYTGDAGLGGYGLGFGKIDTRPFQDLARYTMLYNKSEYDQRQKDAVAKANELSDALSYDLTSSIPKDAKVLQDKYNGLVSYLRDNPDAVDYKNQKKWLEYKKMRNDLTNDIQQAGVRNTMNLGRQNEIDATTQPELKQYLQDKLDQEIEATDIRTPLRHSAKYDIAPVPITEAPTRKFGVTDVGRNVIGTADWTVLDQAALNNQAATLATGLANSTDFAQQPDFQKLPPQVQARIMDQYKAQQASGKLLPVKMAENFNAAIQNTPGFFTTTPDGKKVVDMNAVLKSDNGLVRGNAEQIQTYNNAMDQMVKYIKSGYFKDEFGRELHFGNDASGLRESDYKKIDLTDGLQPEELLKMQIWGASKTQPTREIKLLQTDNEIQRENIAARWQELGLQKEKFNYQKSGSIVGADSVLREVADVINSGQPFTRTHNGKAEKVQVISDPNLIKEFATIDKEGKEVNRPDDVVFNPQTNGLTLTYYKRPEKIREHELDEDGKPIADKYTGNYVVKPGQNVGPDGYLLNNRGERIVADEKPLNARQWMGQVVGRKFSADDKGQVNNLVNEVYDKIGEGSLLKLAAKYKPGATPPETGTTETGTSKQSASGSTTNVQKQSQGAQVPEGTRADWHASGWTDNLIDRAVKDGKIKVTD